MLKIPRVLFEEMIEHLRASYPLEGCGLLGGKDGLAAHHYPVQNRLASPNEYEMDPQEQVSAILEMEQLGIRMLAIYHSHPNGPEMPSPSDVAKAYYPDVYQIVVSLRDFSQPIARAFTIVDGLVKEEALQVADG